MTGIEQKLCRRLSSIAVAAGIALGLAGIARAEVILSQHTSEFLGHGSTNLYNWTQLNDGVDQAWLEVTFPETAVGPPDAWYDVVYVQATNLFAGTWTTNMYVHFDFWAETVEPRNVELMWKSSTNTTLWGHSFTPPGDAGQTNTYAVGFGNYTNDWKFAGDGGIDQYLSDLSTIDWIGVYIFRTGSDPQAYGLDDVTLSIPEPPEMILLGSAVLISLASLRRRRQRTAGL